jgi:hypothetical protein
VTKATTVETGVFFTMHSTLALRPICGAPGRSCNTERLLRPVASYVIEPCTVPHPPQGRLV